MADSTVWWLLAGTLVALELISGTFYLLMLAGGAAAGALAAHMGLSQTGQLVAAALVGGGAVAVWYKLRPRPQAGLPARANRDVNLDIGETVLVDQWSPEGTAQIKYRGATWTVALAPEHAGAAAPGQHRIQEVVGNRLVVAPVR